MKFSFDHYHQERSCGLFYLSSELYHLSILSFTSASFLYVCPAAIDDWVLSARFNYYNGEQCTESLSALLSEQ